MADSAHPVSPQEDGAPGPVQFGVDDRLWPRWREESTTALAYQGDRATPLHARILDLFSAIDQLKAKLATANERSHEGHAAHAASFDALAAISLLTFAGQRVDDYDDVVRAVEGLRRRAEIAEREMADTSEALGEGPYTSISEHAAALRERAERAERRVIEVMESTRQPHFIQDEDCWFSCPKALDEEGKNACCNEAEVRKDRCNCGADAFNAKLDAKLAALRSPSAAPPNDA